MRTPPRSTVPHHGVEDGQQLPHARHQCHLLRFARSHQPLVERLDGRVVSAGDQRPHVERFSYPPSATPHTPTASEGARIPVERSYAHQSREFPGRKRAKLWELCQKRSAQDRSDSGNASQESFVLFEGGVVLDGFIEVPVDTREFLLKPADVRCDAPSEGLGGASTEAVLLGCHHLDDLPSASEDGLKLPRFRVGKRPPGSGTHCLGEARKDLGIESIGLGEPTRGTGEVSGLSGIEHTDGDPCRSEHGGHGALEAATGFEDHEGGAQIFEPTKELIEPILIVGYDKGLSRGEEGHIQVSFGDVDTDVEPSSSSSSSSSWWGIQVLLTPFALPARPGLPNLAGAGSKTLFPAQATVRAPPGVLGGRDDPGFHTASLESQGEFGLSRPHYSIVDKNQNTR